MKFILRTIWNGMAVFGVICFCCCLLAAVYLFRNGPGLYTLASKVAARAGVGTAVVEKVIQQPSSRPKGIKLPDPGDPDWKGHGARNDRRLSPVIYHNGTKPVPLNWYRLGQVSPVVMQKKKRRLEVSTVKQLLKAVKEVSPGDVITLAPGVYDIKAYSVTLQRGGTPGLPVCVRAEQPGSVRIDFDTLEGFVINAPFWIFENLEIKGVRTDHNRGEHAFHVLGRGKSFVLRNCRVHEFNAMIKANGTVQPDGGYQYPDHALIENSSFYNSTVRRTSRSVTFIDVVSGNGWIVRGNLICDFAKGQGNRISYAAFMKGNSTGGVFENNLVVGEYRTRGGVRVGLSLGGGGTGQQFARDQVLPAEHTGGMIRNNVIMYCNDVGIYLNNAAGTRIYNNTLYKTMGIDVRFGRSDAVLKNNISTSRIKNRDGGKCTSKNNIISGVADIFKKPETGDFTLKNKERVVDRAEALMDVFEDFCGSPRVMAPDMGAFEYDTPPCRPMEPF